MAIISQRAMARLAVTSWSIRSLYYERMLVRIHTNGRQRGTVRVQRWIKSRQTWSKTLYLLDRSDLKGAGVEDLKANKYPHRARVPDHRPGRQTLPASATPAAPALAALFDDLKGGPS